MKLIIDTNILLDVIFERMPFFDDSREILRLCESRKINGYITASSVTDLFYLIYKYTHDTKTTYAVMDNVYRIVSVLSVTKKDVMAAHEIKAADFEDALLATCANLNGCDGIITRNEKDFARLGVKTYAPKDFLMEI